VRPYLFSVDQFFANGEAVRSYAELLKYDYVLDPLDATTKYPGVNMDVPQALQNEVSENLRIIFCNRPVKINMIGFRLSLSTEPQSAWWHADTPVAQYNLIVYLDKARIGGTAIGRHKNGMWTYPESKEEVALWAKDTNDPSKWEMLAFVDSDFNRAAIIPSYLQHARMPRDGYGTSVQDGRLTMLAFFDIVGTEAEASRQVEQFINSKDQQKALSDVQSQELIPPKARRY